MKENAPKDLRFFTYMWQRLIKKSSTEGIFCFIAIVVGVCVLWRAMLPHINQLLVSWNNQWIQVLEESWIVAALYTISAIYLSIYIYLHIRKKAHLSPREWALWSVLTIIYSYYRWCSNAFCFYGNEYVKWLDIIYFLDATLIGCDISYYVRMWKLYKTQTEKESVLLRDDAITHEQNDLFGYARMAAELQIQINSVDLSSKAFSVGIVGEWGVGKSSLLNLFSKQQEDAGQIVVRFSPRSSKKVEMIQETFFSEFSHELRKYSYSASYLIGKYAYALNIHSSTRWMYSMIDLFNSWTATSEKAQINEQIQSIGKRIYVIIEDLDRLTGPEILEVLKLIDTNGNFCNTVFITAYDKDYVSGVLQKLVNYEGSHSHYTDKYFQYEFSLFKQPQEELRNFLNEHIFLWAKMLVEDPSIKLTIENEWKNVVVILSAQLTTLRQVKRYVNYFRVEYQQAFSKVDFGDFVVVSLIRFLDVKTYNQLYQKAYVEFSGRLLKDKTHYTLKSNYEQLAGKSHISNFSQMLKYLFGEQQGFRQYDSIYNRIYRTVSYDNYFYYNQKDRVYYEDLCKMMSAASIEDAIAMMDQYLQTITMSRRCIMEFLCSRESAWIQTASRLQRYVCLLIYANAKMSSLELSLTWSRMLSVNSQTSYATIMSAKTYTQCVLGALNKMIAYVPYTIGIYMRNHLQDRLKPLSEDHDYWIETIDQDEGLILRALKQYDIKLEPSIWDAKESLTLAYWIPGEDKKYYSRRLLHIRSMIENNPEMYAQGLLKVEAVGNDNKNAVIELFGYRSLVGFMKGPKGFDKWIEYIPNKHLRYIYSQLHIKGQQENEASAIIENTFKNTEDYRGIEKALKRSIINATKS